MFDKNIIIRSSRENDRRLSLVTYAGHIQSFSLLNLHHSKLTLINQQQMHRTKLPPYFVLLLDVCHDTEEKTCH